MPYGKALLVSEIDVTLFTGRIIRQEVPDPVRKVRVTRRDLSNEKKADENISKSKSECISYLALPVRAVVMRELMIAEKGRKESKKKVTRTAKSMRIKKSKSDETVDGDPAGEDLETNCGGYDLSRSLEN